MKVKWRRYEPAKIKDCALTAATELTNSGHVTPSPDGFRQSTISIAACRDVK